MSNLVIILGESGTGKSSSIRTLNPESTFLINPLSKPLPFRGYKSKYGLEKKNYLESESYSEISSYIKAINDRRPEITSIILDDFNFLMNNEFMVRCRETGFAKYTDMARHVFEIMQSCKDLRPDLYCFMMCHTERDHAGVLKPKTVGKMTADYVGIAERSSIVLHSRVVDGKYCFQTRHDGEHMSKTPMGMFNEMFIDNNLSEVRAEIESYFNEEE
jgi:hypothetical protein